MMLFSGTWLMIWSSTSSPCPWSSTRCTSWRSGRATLPAWPTGRSSLLRLQPLYLDSTTTSSKYIDIDLKQLLYLHFRSLPSEFFQDVGFGPTTWTYHVSLYFAPWNRYQPYLVWASFNTLQIFCQIGALFGYILHHTRGQKLKLDLVVNLLFWQVTYLILGSCHPNFLQASFLAAFAVVYGLYDLRTGGQTTLFMATAYNAFQVFVSFLFMT